MDFTEIKLNPAVVASSVIVTMTLEDAKAALERIDREIAADKKQARDLGRAYDPVAKTAYTRMRICQRELLMHIATLEGRMD
jgi:hypothetical protein